MNRERAQWAETAMRAFAAEVGLRDDDDQTILHDLLADVGRYCDRNNLDFTPVVADAISCWCVERDDPDDCDIGPGPQVSILIHGRERPNRTWRQALTKGRARKGRGGAK